MPTLQGLGGGLRGLAGLALDALLPPRCLACGQTVEGAGALCAGCWEAIDFLAPPFCAVCGLPFEFDLGPEALCGACARDPPPFDRARAVMRYDQASKGLILGFKYADRTEGAKAYGAWLARAGAELLTGDTVIVPVPLHWRRTFIRRYNQAALLAWALGRVGGHAVVPDLLVRKRPTPPQGHLSREARRRNVAGAFALDPKRAALARDRPVLLVDDVLTTGATVSACARALRAAGAAGISVVTLARVAGSGD